MSLVFRADPLKVRDLLASVRATLARIGTAEAELHAVELVLAEVVNNIFEHAYDGRPGGRVRLRMARTAHGLQLTVIDGGRPFAGGAPPAPRDMRAPRSPAEAPEGGFGWQLIHLFGRDIAYRRNGRDNVLSFVIPLA